MLTRSTLHGRALAVLCGVVCSAGCSSDRIGSQLEFEAVGACASAIEERRGRERPPAWQYVKEERDGLSWMAAWAPGRDPESVPPDYSCLVIRDDDVRQGVRVVEVVEGRGAG